VHRHCGAAAPAAGGAHTNRVCVNRPWPQPQRCHVRGVCHCPRCATRSRECRPPGGGCSAACPWRRVRRWQLLQPRGQRRGQPALRALPRRPRACSSGASGGMRWRRQLHDGSAMRRWRHGGTDTDGRWRHVPPRLHCACAGCGGARQHRQGLGGARQGRAGRRQGGRCSWGRWRRWRRCRRRICHCHRGPAQRRNGATLQPGRRRHGASLDTAAAVDHSHGASCRWRGARGRRAPLGCTQRRRAWGAGRRGGGRGWGVVRPLDTYPRGVPRGKGAVTREGAVGCRVAHGGQVGEERGVVAGLNAAGFGGVQLWQIW
jgi:hypothetical protein